MRSAVRTVLGLLALSACARPTEAELERRFDAQVDEVEAGAETAESPRDASMAGLDAALDANEPPAQDARSDADVAAPILDANVAQPVADASAPGQDASEPLECDITPCQGHCPFGNVCCSPILTCGCQISADQPCVLPPIGTN